MLKLYNTQTQITSELSKFFKFVFPTISKPHLKIVPDIIFGIIKAESVITTDIIKKIKNPWSVVQFSSIERRFERFFNNPKFLPYDFYDTIIYNIINNYKFSNNNVYIAFDHMYCKNNFTVFLLSLRIAKQGIPLWFRCFKGTHNPEAFNLSLMKQGISFVHDLFKNKKCNLIFLADRWFNFRDVMHHIDFLGDTYCIRTKTNISIEVANHPSYNTLSDIKPFLSKSKLFNNVKITSFNFPTNLAISQSPSHKDPFYILTNANPRFAIKHYGYRFGSTQVYI